jgi:integrase
MSRRVSHAPGSIVSELRRELRRLGVRDTARRWGLRPGEALQLAAGLRVQRRVLVAALHRVLADVDFRKEHVEYRWERASDALGLNLTWYQATRHSFASRNLSRGVPLDEVAAALGHSTPAVTARHYAHFIRKTFSPLMTAALAPVDGGGKVLPIAAARAPVSPGTAVAAGGAEIDRPLGTEGADAA